MNIINDIFIPSEIWFIITGFLEISDFSFLLTLSKYCNIFFDSILQYRLKSLQWKIIIDYVRESNHHIQLHKIWIKIGNFDSKPNDKIIQRNLNILNTKNESNKNGKRYQWDLWDYHEICKSCISEKHLSETFTYQYFNTNSKGKMKYNRITLRGNSLLHSILYPILKNYQTMQYARISRGLYPTLLGFTEQEENTSDELHHKYILMIGSTIVTKHKID
jgi:hypothetical protein